MNIVLIHVLPTLPLPFVVPIGYESLTTQKLQGSRISYSLLSLIVLGLFFSENISSSKTFFTTGNPYYLQVGFCRNGHPLVPLFGELKRTKEGQRTILTNEEPPTARQKKEENEESVIERDTPVCPSSFLLRIY